MVMAPMGQTAEVTFRYVPHERQVAFHQSGARYKLFMGGVRSGKTVAGTAEFFVRAMRVAGLYAVIAPTYRMVKDVEIVEWLRWIPAETIGNMVHGSEPECTLVNGSRILFRTGERPDRLRGLTLNGFRIGEAALLRTNEVWEICQSRVLSTGGWGLLDTTPKGRNWVYDEFLGAKRRIARAKSVTTCRTAENPTLSAEAVAELRESYSDKMAEQELDAICVEGWDGLVYPEFRPDIHIREKLEYLDGRDLALCVDWGVTNPTVVLALQVDTQDRVLVLGEKRFTGKPASVTAEETRAWLSERGWWREGAPLPRVYHDPSGADEALEWQRGGFRRMLTGDRSVKAGTEAVHWVMRERPTPEGAPRDAGLLIDASCDGLIDELTRYQYEGGEKEEPRKIDDHGPDALRYGVSGLMVRLNRKVRERARR